MGHVLPVVATASVVGIGMAAGFAHTHAAAVRAGQTGWLAWADAVVIELMALVAGWQLVQAHRAGHSGVFPGVVMVVAFVVQMGSQVSGAPRTPAGWLFAALPALGALVTVKLLMQARAHAASRGAEETPPVRHVDSVREPRPAPEPAASPKLEPAPVEPAPVVGSEVVTVGDHAASKATLSGVTSGSPVVTQWPPPQ